MRMSLRTLRRVYPGLPESIEIAADGWSVHAPELAIKNEKGQLLNPSIGLWCKHHHVLMTDFVNELGSQLEAQTESLERLRATEPVHSESIVLLKADHTPLASVTPPLKIRKSAGRK